MGIDNVVDKANYSKMSIMIIIRIKGLLQLCSLCWSRCLFFFCCVETRFVYHDLASVFLQVQESLLFFFLALLFGVHGTSTGRKNDPRITLFLGSV